MKRKRLLTLLGSACLVLILAALPFMGACAKPAPAPPPAPAPAPTPPAPTPAPAFPTKTISWIVPYGPGGGFDTVSRSYAQAMSKVLGETVVVKNMPGAAGRLGWSTLHKAEPDGYTVGAYNIPGGIIGQLVYEAAYDYRKVSWVGSMKNAVYCLIVPKDSPFQSIEDFKKSDKPIRFVEIGVGASSWIAGVTVAETIGFPYTFVTGYKSHPEMAVAMIRGEGDAQIVALESSFVLEHLKAGDVRVLATFTKERDPLAPEVPTAAEIGYPQLTGLGLYYACGGPPGIPDDVLKILRNALIKASHDKENIERLEKAGYAGLPIPGDELAKMVEETLFPSFERQVGVFREAMAEK